MKGKRRATKLVERRGEVIKIICSLKTYFIDFFIYLSIFENYFR